jgi:hypothetical protein
MEKNRLLQAFTDNDTSVISGYCRPSNGKTLSSIALGNIHDVKMNFSSNLRWLGTHCIGWKKASPHKECASGLEYEMTGFIKEGKRSIAKVFIYFRAKGECGEFVAQLIEQKTSRA